MIVQKAVLRIARDEGLRHLGIWWSANVQVALADDYVWVQYPATDQRLARQARGMPADRFGLHGEWLIREGQQIAEARLPQLDWQPIAKVIQFQIPWVGQAGQTAQLPIVHWRLERGGAERDPAGAILTWDRWSAWVETAPQARLDRLRYCISYGPEPTMALDHAQALVIGTPIPPVQATYLVAIENVLIPAGFHWLPELDVSCVQRSFQLAAHQRLLWLTSADWWIIDDATLVQATRGSVRLAAQAGIHT